MTLKEWSDAILKLLEILISWPVIVLVTVILIRRQLPELLGRLAERITEAPGGFKFAELKEAMDQIATKVERIEERIRFEAAPSLTPEIQARLEDRISSFREYLRGLGFEPEGGQIMVRMEPGSLNAAYYPQDNCIAVDPLLAHDPDVVYREYTHHALYALQPGYQEVPTYAGIESGLADYFPCSYQDRPLLGAGVAQVLGDQYGWEPEKRTALRNLDNQRSFSEAPNDRDTHSPHDVGEIWGGAFWELRAALGPGVADHLLFTAWAQLPPADGSGDKRRAFVRHLLALTPTLAARSRVEELRPVFERRGLNL